MRRSFFKNSVVYLILIVGAVVFSMPFVWMASSSAKVEGELFGEKLNILPKAPSAPSVSPYIADSDDSGPGNLDQALLGKLVELIGRKGFQLPQPVADNATMEGVAEGVYRKLQRMLPKDIWAEGPEKLVAEADKQLDIATIRSIFRTMYRRFCLGQIRVRSGDFHVQELGVGRRFSERLENETPRTCSLADDGEGTVGFAVVQYNFEKSNRVILTQTFDLDFDAAKLQWIRLQMQPDDSWHELWLTMEKLGRRYVAERPVVLGETDWKKIIWRERGREDYSTTMKRDWCYLLRDVGRSESYVQDPHKLKLSFELRRVGWLKSWWHKITYNYYQVLEQIPFWRYVRTSLFLVMANIVLTVFACSLVAYAFARLQWPGRDLCFMLMLTTMMIPKQVTMIPTFLIWKNLGAYNTLTPLWLGSAFGSAFFIFMLRQFLKGIPRDLEDAARIDGCGFLRIYWHIMMPLIKPSLAAIAIFTFMGSWNDFMGPLIYIADQRLYPLAFGLYAFAVEVENNPVLSMSASLMMTLPVIVIFFFAQRYFIQGVTLTGTKG